MTSSRSIFAFTRDLRLGDHAGLALAARYGDVVPVLVIDPASASRLRRSPRRAAFYCAAVRALDDALRARGTSLIVRRGPVGSTVRALARAVGASVVAWSIAYDAKGVRADRDLQSTLEEAGLRAQPVHAGIVIAPEDALLANRGGHGWRSFVPYHERWRTLVPAPREAKVRFARVEIASEALPDPAEFGSQATLDRPVSETAALETLAHFLAAPVLNYVAGRNVPAADGTSGLSADLSFGTIAPRTIVRAVSERGSDPFLLVEERMSLRMFLRALALRDFFLQLAWHTETLEEVPLQKKMREFRFARTHAHLDAWRSGRTGFPLVDAGMRELRATGAMHPRVRSIAASFLCFDLGVDWRVGRDAWEAWLIEDAPALSTGNWQWIAGVGADLAAYPRVFNPLKQARRFDPTAAYIRRWIPELAAQPDQVILDPIGGRAASQLQLGLFGPRDYPAPILDHEVAARGFLERYGREVGPVSA